MKCIVFIICVFISNTALAIRPIKVEFDNCSLINGDFLWMSKTELSNSQYREFVEDNVNDFSILPDSSLWGDKIGFSESYEKYYFRHPAYNDYPVVCISKENAIKYCSWLTGQINLKLNDSKENIVKEVIVRLPTEIEWKNAAKGGLSKYNILPWTGNSLRYTEGKNQGLYRLNFKRGKGDYMGVAGSLNDNADVTAPVKSYWPNNFGLYNMCGNVSEMLSDCDYSFGGNWSSNGYDVAINSKIFTQVSSTIGFRYVIEVVKWKAIKHKSKLKINKQFFAKNFISRNDSFRIMNMEVSNELYNIFLNETNYSRPDSNLWNNKFSYSNQYTIKYHWHPDYHNYPIVNISKEDVYAFSSWLSSIYNRIYEQKVIIKLPTEKQWELAARGKENISVYYPWGGPYIRNAQGEYLCNFKPVPEIYAREDKLNNSNYNFPKGSNLMLGADLDGYLVTSKVDSYNSNNIGVYNMSGNVAEMIDDIGFTKGGSWNSDMSKIQINNRETDCSPCAEVGFRLVMIDK